MDETSAGLTTLPQDTVKLLKCSQVVTSVWSGVKELIENSLDAGANVIEVRLEDYGLSKLSVRDNGCGVDKQNVPCMVMAHTTSKLQDFCDLEKLQTYGFRGEALSSLCSVSKLSIITRTKKDLAATSFLFNTSGSVESAKTNAAKIGTEIVAENLFFNLPVRRNFYKSGSKKKEEIKRVEKLIHSFAIINGKVRFSFYHNKTQLFGSLVTDRLSDGIAGVIGRNLVKNMESFLFYFDKAGAITEGSTEMSVEGVVPSLQNGMGAELGRCLSEKTWIFINKRPVDDKEIEKLLRDLFSEAAKLESSKYPVSCVSIIMSGTQLGQIDQNLEPNKQKVGIGCKSSLLLALESTLKGIWKIKIETEHAPEDLDDTYGQDLAKFETGSPDSKEPCAQFIDSAETDVSKSQIGPLIIDSSNLPCFSSSLESKNKEKPVIPDIPQDQSILHDNVLVCGGEEQSSINKEAINSAIPLAESMERNSGSGYQPSETEEYISLHCSEIKRFNDNIPEGYENLKSTDFNSEIDLLSETSHKGERSPVLKQSMFETPDLPDVDAVYINRLKSGDDPFEEEEELECSDFSEVEKPRNPFIQYECEDGNQDLSESEEIRRRDYNLESTNQNSRNLDENFAMGRMLDLNGHEIEPVRLFTPTPSSTKKLQKYENKRKLQADESVIRIDEFLSKRQKIKKGPIGDLTLAHVAAPDGTPIIKTKRHIMSRKRLDIPFDIKRCFQKNGCSNKAIIGPLLSGWVVKDDKDLALINPPRIREMVLYDRLLSSHVLPSEKLPEPITVYPGIICKELADVAVNMFTNTKHCPVKVTDRRITFNGFSLALYNIANPQATDSFSLKLEGKCPLIQYIGVDDLIEILKLSKDSSGDCVKTTRPRKVKEYLATEATRMSRELPSEIDMDALENLLSDMNRILKNTNTCLHGKSIVTTLSTYNADENLICYQ